MSKRLLADQLRERTDTIEYRAIKAQLMKYAQNEKRQYRILTLQGKTFDRLKNEGINVELITEFGTEKYLLTW